MQALGSETSLVLRGDMPLRGFDEDLRRELTAQLVGHGLDLRNETIVQRIEREGGALRVDTDQGAIEADAVIYATGREPLANTSGIGLGDPGRGDGADRCGRRSTATTRAACRASWRSATAPIMPAAA